MKEPDPFSDPKWFGPGGLGPGGREVLYLMAAAEFVVIVIFVIKMLGSRG